MYSKYCASSLAVTETGILQLLLTFIVSIKQKTRRQDTDFIATHNLTEKHLQTLIMKKLKLN